MVNPMSGTNVAAAKGRVSCTSKSINVRNIYYYHMLNIKYFLRLHHPSTTLIKG